MSGRYGFTARRWVWLLPLLALGACQSNPTPAQVESKIGDTLPIVCAGVDVAWMGWQAYTADHTVKAATLGKVNGAYFAAKEVCANPPSNAAEGLVTVGKAYFAFTAAVKAAKDGVNAGTSGPS